MSRGAANLPRSAPSSAAEGPKIDGVLMLQADEGGGADVPDIGALAMVASDEKPKDAV